MLPAEILEGFGVRLSLQRIAIMEYLTENRTHPTAEDIYIALAPKIPTLSRTTVYNTLSILASRGAILALDLDAGQMHYDGDTSPHAHFICTCCGKIHDIMPRPRAMRKVASLVSPPRGAEINTVQITYKGICVRCQKQS